MRFIYKVDTNQLFHSQQGRKNQNIYIYQCISFLYREPRQYMAIFLTHYYKIDTSTEL